MLRPLPAGTVVVVVSPTGSVVVVVLVLVVLDVLDVLDGVVVVVESGGEVQVAVPVGYGATPLLIAQVTVSTCPAW